MGNGKANVFKTPVVFATLFLLYVMAGNANAQLWFPYTGDSSANKILDTLSLVGEASQAIETNHPLLANWLLWGARGMVTDCMDNLPNGRFRQKISRAIHDLRNGKEKRGLRGVIEAQEELRRLSAVWSIGGVETRMAEVRALVEKGRCQDAVAWASPLETLVRIDPGERFLEDAARMVNEADKSREKGHGGDALDALSESSFSLRSAYIASRLTQAKILVAHARRMMTEGKKWRPSWAIRRASRKLRNATCVATKTQVEAIVSIGSDLERAHSMLKKKDSAAPESLQKIEERITDLLKKVGAPRSLQA